MALHTKVDAADVAATVDIHPHHTATGASTVPRWRMAEGEIEPRVAYQIIHDELMLDGNSRLNLATFVTTWMEPEARRPDRRVPRQEHDRQGRVPADRGAREALRQHARRPVGRDAPTGTRPAARRPAPARRACSAGWRSSGAGAAPRAAAADDARTWSWAPTCRSAGRSSAATGRSSRGSCRSSDGGDAPDRRRARPRPATRTRSASSPILGSTFDGSYEAGRRDRRSARRPRRRRRPRRAAARRRARRAASSRRSSTRTWSGTSASPRVAVDQRLGPQVRAGLPGRRLGRLARRRAARGSDLPRRLPRRRHADVRAELLAPGAQVVAQYYKLLRLGTRGLPPRPADRARHRDVAVGRDRRRSGTFELISRRRRAAGVRVQGQATARAFTVYDVSRGAPRARLDAAGVPDAAEGMEQAVDPARRRAQRLQPRPRAACSSPTSSGPSSASAAEHASDDDRASFHH